MTREILKEKMKNGPPLSKVAKILGMSRPKLYRHMEYYMNGEDDKVDHNLKEYFDKIVMDQLTDGTAMERELEQIGDFIKAEDEAKVDELRKEYDEYIDRLRYYEMHEDIMSTKDKIEKKETLDSTLESIKARIKEFNKTLDDLVDEEDEGPSEPEWNEGEIRSAPVSSYHCCMVMLDADFGRCGDITLELVLKISGKEFVMKRLKAQENERFVRVDFQDMPAQTGYRLKWMEGDQIRTTPVYPLDTYFRPFF